MSVRVHGSRAPVGEEPRHDAVREGAAPRGRASLRRRPRKRPEGRPRPGSSTTSRPAGATAAPFTRERTEPRSPASASSACPTTSCQKTEAAEGAKTTSTGPGAGGRPGAGASPRGARRASASAASPNGRADWNEKGRSEPARRTVPEATRRVRTPHGRSARDVTTVRSVTMRETSTETRQPPRVGEGARERRGQRRRASLLLLRPLRDVRAAGRGGRAAVRLEERRVPRATRQPRGRPRAASRGRRRIGPRGGGSPRAGSSPPSRSPRRTRGRGGPTRTRSTSRSATRSRNASPDSPRRRSPETSLTASSASRIEVGRFPHRCADSRQSGGGALGRLLYPPRPWPRRTPDSPRAPRSWRGASSTRGS